MSNQENISKETKKTRRKKSQRKSQQIKLAVIMIMVSVLVLSASTFAWYQLNNTAKINDMKFTADTMGNLLIAPETEQGDEGNYDHQLSLGLEANAEKLLPATADVDAGSGAGAKQIGYEDFYYPKYAPNGQTVAELIPLGEENFNKYVYKKVFYLKSGETAGTGNTFTLKLDVGNTANRTGTYVVDSDAENNSISGLTAANALRISFVIESTGNNPSIVATKVYEPNSDSSAISEGSFADYTGSDVVGSTAYNDKLIKQLTTGDFAENQVTTLCTLTEGVPVRVTMYVWIEGQDADCKSEIALDTIEGQIQFIAE